MRCAGGVVVVIGAAGPGTGAASANGNITLQNAGTSATRLDNLTVSGNDFTALTVYLSGNFNSQLTGNQVFAADTLNAGGDVNSNVSGNAAGHIVSQGTVNMSVGGDVAGVISGDTLTVSAGSITNSTLTGATSINVAADQISGTMAAPTVTVAGNTLDVSVTTTSLDVTGAGTVNGTWSQVVTQGSGNLQVNGEQAQFTTVNGQQLVVEGFALPPGTQIGANGALILPAGVVIGLLSPGGGTPRVVLVHSVQLLGELLSEGYVAIVIDLSDKRKDENMQVVSN